MESKIVILLSFVYVTSGNPAIGAEMWRRSPANNMIEDMRISCASGTDTLACFKVKVMTFLDTAMKNDSFKVSNNVEVRSNGHISENSGRGEKDIMEMVESYIQNHDVSFDFPSTNTVLTVSSKNLDNDQLNLNFKFLLGDNQEARKSKLKKIAIPIMVFVLLKALTLIPLALGILGLKAWNAVQLGFFSFVTSVGLAIFQLCKKITSDHHPHGVWDSRNLSDEPIFENEAQNLAYNAYS